MKFEINIINYVTVLWSAVYNENIEIIKLLLTNENIDVNIPCILILFHMKFKIISFNGIQNHIF